MKMVSNIKTLYDRLGFWLI